jgi:hypothetical protein
MNSSIDVQRKAYPLTISSLYEVLISASSADRRQSQAGALQLSTWEKQEGYYSSLQVDIFLDIVGSV